MEVLVRRHYDQALRGARTRRFRERLTGRSSGLVPFSYLQRVVEMTHQRYRGIQAVPIAQIIGSLDRSGDFDRIFAPTQQHSSSKWMSVDSANIRGVYLPPIKLYKVGEAYFVVDGHHRVSVARHQGQTYIDAEVIEVESRVPVTAELTMEDLDLLGPYSDFIKATRLDELRPGANIRATRPDSYARLLDHIYVHRYFIDQKRAQPSSWGEAVIDWYDNTYLPFVKAIRKKHLNRDFPSQTETDLYLWVIDHAYYLSKRYQHNITPEQAALDFVSRFSRRPQRVLERFWVNLLDRLAPSQLEAGPRAGTWREERLDQETVTSLFRDILVAVSGAETGWLALSQAGEIARRESGVLHGLHVLLNDTPEAHKQGEMILQEFAFRCQGMGIPFTTSLEVGDIEQRIIEKAHWSDLIVINQRKVHGQWADVPLGTIFHGVAEKAARPILAVPGTLTRAPQKLLLAYDGSPKSREALFVMRELISRWRLEGVILTVAGQRTSREMLDAAWQYVGHSAKTTIESRFESGQPHEVILSIMREENASILIMGGYGYKPLLKAFLGSTVDLVLREAWFPVLICR
ncbi:MAG: universal stress protein [Chloroflexi bacterium]|nr:universal stress protein [Chloroflexota bacterium]